MNILNDSSETIEKKKKLEKKNKPILLKDILINYAGSAEFGKPYTFTQDSYNQFLLTTIKNVNNGKNNIGYLAITENARPQAIITLGIPDEKPPEPSKIPLTHIAFLEKYNNKIENLDAVMGYYGADIQKKIEAGKESLGKVASHVEEKSINIFQKIIEKFKKS